MEQKRKHRVADQLVDMLAGAGVKNVYAITGDSLNDITEAISNDSRLHFVHMRHEESGAFAASAEAQLTGHLACCAGSSGPGHIHLINGLYDAQRANAPVLALASTCPSGMYGIGYFQATNPTLLFSNCSVYNQNAITPEQFPVMLHGAMQSALGQGGVGIVAIPEDLNGAQAVPSPAASAPLLSPRLPLPDPSLLQTCAQLINSAKSVVIYAGCGCRNAMEQLNAFAAKVKAPVATTFKSTMLLTGNCPNYVGHIGYMGMWSAQHAIDRADVCLLIGENFPFMGEFPTDKKLIQVDIRAERLGKRAKVDVGLCADAAEFLTALLPLVDEKTSSSLLQEALTNWHTIEQAMADIATHPGSPGLIRPEYLFAMLNSMAAKDCIFTVDTGMNCVWASHYLRPAKGRQMVGSFTHGSMANAMPMAIGAVMGCPGRQVIALCGDGGLAMLMGELLTIGQYRLPVKLLVANNSSLAYVAWEMQLAGMTPVQTDLVNPDFAALARTIGFEAESVTDPTQLPQAMSRWLAASGPALLSVATDKSATSFTFSSTPHLGS